jgi:hypothetical protein
MAFLSQFLSHEQVAKLTDAQVDQLADHVNFVFNQQAAANPELKAAIEKSIKPAAAALLKG